MDRTGQGAGHDDPPHDDETDVTPDSAENETDVAHHATDATRGASATGTASTRSARPVRRPTSQAVIDQRVSYVLSHMVAGYGFPEIRQRVTKSHAKEAEKRKEWHDKADDPAASVPTLLWGLDETPPSDRTIHRYIRAAKDQLETGGSKVAKLGDRLLGLQLERINRVWRLAQRGGRVATMARLIEITNNLFALDGAIRPALSALAPTGERVGELEPPPDASQTETSAADELAHLLALGQQRRAQALAAQATLH
jgi:hypothetical protein